MESIPGEDAAKTAEMTTKDLEYYKNLVDKAVTGFERIDSSFKRSSTVGKILSNSIACCRKIIHERKRQEITENCTFVLFYKIAAATPVFSSHHPDQSAAITIEAGPSTGKRITTCSRLN